MKLHISQAVTLKKFESESYSGSVARLWTVESFLSDQMPVRMEVSDDMRSEVGNGGAIEYAQIEVVKADGQEARLDPTRMEPHVEQLTGRLNGT